MLDRQSDYIYKTTAKETYGLTDGWIKRLGEPDKVAPHPHYRSKKSYLYLRARVEAFIDAHKDEYEKLLAGREKRRAKAQAVMDRRINELKTWAAEVEIQVSYEIPPLRRLYRAVRNHGHTLTKDVFFTMSPAAVVAFIRHNGTNYEELLREIEGKPGCRYAYMIIRQRIDAKIGSALEAKFGAGVWERFER